MWWSESVNGHESKQENFVVNSVFDWEPVKTGCDVVEGRRFGDDLCKS